MSRQFERQLLEAVCRLMPTDGHSLASEDIWQDLTQRGITVEPNAMDEIFTAWQRQGLIRAAEPIGSAAIRQHGHRIITWISTSLCR